MAGAGVPRAPGLEVVPAADLQGLLDRLAEPVEGDDDVLADLAAPLRGDGDRYLEHALIYALIRIADRDTTLAGLTDPTPQVRRAALIALDQMKGGNLSRSQVALLLDTGDPALQ